jgi:hypothetical protein
MMNIAATATRTTMIEEIFMIDHPSLRKGARS